MSALLDSLSAGFSGDAARRAVLDEALRDGLPGPRTEAWKYTSLRQLERRSFAAVDALPSLDPMLLADIPAPRAVFVNGRYSVALSLTTDLPDGVSLQLLSEALADGGDAARFLQRRFERTDEVFARLNAALATEGLLLRAEADVRSEKPLHLVFIGTDDGADRAWHLRNLIELRAGASLTVVEHHLAATPHAHFINALSHVHLAVGATLSHARVQTDSDRATTLLRTDAVLARDADYRRVDLELGGALSRHELNVRLEGDNARLAANGVLLAGGRRHVDTRLGIDHIGRDTACELTWRGLGAGRGRAVFHGGILIREGADGTDAALSNKNLLLSDNAEIDTQPVLEIHADEVKAAHGATVGQLDANALFYLRSRGLTQPEARQLLTTAFCREPLGVIEDVSVRDALLARVDAALAAVEAG
ncbi:MULTISPECIES: Fe-S cluster assembly protein SufD [unclassified Pseudoxanthomonas]|uniref:Fe-S cluster assembly protein SufD n=1 Tax=unclassified Pseudoxanthomonas TaxID=2645906 RepID=UPI0008E0B925|nr:MULTISPECIES: Fe-S cluster assembly protein SufD [unclassified Pseudoxanthomonas]PPJ43448.1 Fe-S cluster assembly protein SufD [Pseudoxanthomonas sp. KAs_5_3]SFV35294.1 Iron-regulated ABC transporter permease protein SufD [Pseudoxanthomonas sp. YR558]